MSYCPHSRWYEEPDGSKTCRHCGENSDDGEIITELDYAEAERVLGLDWEPVVVFDWRGFVIELPEELAQGAALVGCCDHSHTDLWRHCGHCAMEVA